MFYKNCAGNSLIEVVVTLFIFSISIAVISRQVESNISGINIMEKNIAEAYRHAI